MLPPNFIDERIREKLKIGPGLPILVLKVLKDNDSPSSAYDILTGIYQITNQMWKPSPGSIYPALEKLLKDNYIRKTGKKSSTKKDLYEITNEGTDFLNKALSLRLIFSVMMDMKLFSDFEPENIFLPEQDDFFYEKARKMFHNFTAKQGIPPEMVEEHIKQMSKEMRKYRLQEMIKGIDKRIELLNYIKTKIIEKTNSNDNTKEMK